MHTPGLNIKYPHGLCGRSLGKGAKWNEWLLEVTLSPAKVFFFFSLYSVLQIGYRKWVLVVSDMGLPLLP